MSDPAAALDDRMPPLATNVLSGEQALALAQFVAVRGYPARGPFIPLLRSPRLFSRTRELGDYLRFGSPLPADLREIAILMTARKWDQPYEWNAHFVHATAAGVPPGIADAIGRGDRPDGMSPAQIAVYDFCTALLAGGRMSDETYARLASALGELLLVDLIGLVGYYTFLAMTLNAAHTALPATLAHALPTRDDSST